MRRPPRPPPRRRRRRASRASCARSSPGRRSETPPPDRSRRSTSSSPSSPRGRADRADRPHRARRARARSRRARRRGSERRRRPGVEQTGAPGADPMTHGGRLDLRSLPARSAADAPPARRARAQGAGLVRGGRAGSLAASPTLVGAVTVLVVIVAVFLAYQANQGLPFVPTYKLSATGPQRQHPRPGQRGPRRRHPRRPDRERRADHDRDVDPETGRRPSVDAKLDMELNQDLDPLPEDSTVIVRSRSALGLKYLELQRGDSERGLRGRGRRCRSAPPRPSPSRSTRSSTPSTTRPARRSRSNLVEFGNALAGRGQSLNAAIGDLRPLVERLDPVMRNLASPNTDLAGFVRGLSRGAAAEVAPVAASAGPAVRQPRDHLRRLRRRRPALHPGDDLALARGRGRGDRDAASRSGRFCSNTTGLFADLRPGFAALRAAAERRRARPPRSGSRRCASRPPSTPSSIRPHRRCSTSTTTPAFARASTTSTASIGQRAAAAGLRRPGPVGLQLRHPAVPERRPTISPSATASAPTSASSRSTPPTGPEQRGQPAHRRRPTAAGRLRTTSCTPTPTRTRPRPARSRASARPATRSTCAGPGPDRQRPRQPGHRHRRPDLRAARQLRRRRRRRRRRSDGRSHARSRSPRSYDERIYRKGHPPHRIRNALILIALILIGTYFARHQGAPVRRHVRGQGRLRATPPTSARTRRSASRASTSARCRASSSVGDAAEVTFTVDDDGPPIREDAAGRDPPAHLPRGQLLPRRQAGQPERARARPTAARSRSPRPPPRSSSTRS